MPSFTAWRRGLAWRPLVSAIAVTALVLWAITYHAKVTHAVAQLSTLPGPSWSAIVIAVGAVVASYCCSRLRRQTA
jgi:hypothetical protein